MKKQLIIKFIIMYLPFILGLGMFSLCYINLVSSLLLFLGGYISVKNTFDYRRLKKNMGNIPKKVDKKSIVVNVEKKDNNNYIKSINAEDIVGIKRTRRYTRVRRIR